MPRTPSPFGDEPFNPLTQFFMRDGVRYGFEVDLDDDGHKQIVVTAYDPFGDAEPDETIVARLEELGYPYVAEWSAWHQGYTAGRPDDGPLIELFFPSSAAITLGRFLAHDIDLSQFTDADFSRLGDYLDMAHFA